MQDVTPHAPQVWDGLHSPRQSARLDCTVAASCDPPTYSFVCEDGVDLCPEHDTGEEGEEKTFKHAKQGHHEHQRTWHKSITTCVRGGSVRVYSGMR